MQGVSVSFVTNFVACLRKSILRVCLLLVMHTLVGGLLSILLEMKMLQLHWRGKVELGMPSQIDILPC